MIRLYIRQMTRNKIVFLIPIIVLFIILPLILKGIIVIDSDSENMILPHMLQTYHTLVPIFSCWWGILFVNDYFNDNGNEMIYLVNKLPSLIFVYFSGILCYSVLLAIATCIYRSVIYDVSFDLIYQLIVESFAMYSIVFFISFLIRNTAMGIMFSLIYCVYINIFDIQKMFASVSIFPKDILLPIDWNLELKNFVVAIIFFILGLFLYKYNREYK